MDIRVALQVVKALKRDLSRLHPRTASAGRMRLALRWVTAALVGADTLDLWGRLQVLEGAIGVDAGTWADSQDVASAQAAYTEYTDVDPSWFSSRNTGMINQVMRNLGRVLKSFTLFDPEDYLTEVLMGISRITGKQIQRPFYETGKDQTNSILTGRGNPTRIVSPVSKRLINHALGDIRNEKRLQNIRGPEVRDDEFTGNIPDVGGAQLGSTVIDVLTSRGLPLAKAVRSLMRRIFAPSEPMMEFVEGLERGRILSMNEIAKKTGIAPQTVRQSHWQKYMPLFAKAWKNNRRLQNAMSRYLIRSGVAMDEVDLSLADLFQSGEYGKFRRFRLGSRVRLVAHW